MDKEAEVSEINTLIGYTLDSAEGYKEGAEDQEEGRYGEIFTQLSQARFELVRQLQAQVKVMGSDPEDDSTILGALHRRWTFLKSVSTEGDQALLDSLENGEKYLRDQYDEVLQKDLTVETRHLLEAARQKIVEGYESISRLKLQRA